MMIPNPTKKVSVPFTLDQVKVAMSKFPLINPKYSISNSNEVMSLYTLSASEFLSLGVFIDVQLSATNEKTSEISMEVKRKMGAFDKWYEVQEANTHIENVINGISSLLANPDQAVPATPEPQKNAGCASFLIFPIGAALWYLLA
jgi:hypothetical protein